MKIMKWILAAITLLSTVIMLFIFPDKIPVHFDINGIADRWGSKYEMLVLPIMAIITMIMFEIISRFYVKKASSVTDEKTKAEISSNVKVLNLTVWVMSVLFLVMNIFTLYTSYSQVYPEKDLPEFDVIRAVSIVMGLVFIIMGNYMPKTRRNRTIGFRFPWTLYNENTWQRSNRFASYIMMIAGVITIIGALLFKGLAAPIIMLASVTLSLLVILIYAYFVYRDERKKENEGINKE